jgi:hypothetical protein
LARRRTSFSQCRRRSVSIHSRVRDTSSLVSSRNRPRLAQIHEQRRAERTRWLRSK